MKKIYKYIGPKILVLAFSEAGKVSFKCEYPENYNDPYELFLSLDSNDLEPEFLAFYQETVLNQIEQIPTSCFSNSPSIIPMWAHYAHNSKGFVIEVDEEKLSTHVENISIGNVDYEDSTFVSTDQVAKAYTTSKPRHTLLLQRAAFSAAYFTKKKCWKYEEERRILVPSNHIQEKDGSMILFVPNECVTSIISGCRTEEKYKNRSREICEEIGCDYFELHQSRSSPEPYFINDKGDSYIFSEDGFQKAEQYCESCGKPIKTDFEWICPFCAIEESHRRNAAFMNPMRRLAKYGLLEGYLKETSEIEKRK